MISVVIPHLIGVPGADEALKRCVASLYDADEIIVLANEGMGYGPAVNAGLVLTSGHTIIIANNDTYLAAGKLKDLSSKHSVCVPRVLPEPKDHNPRCFFSLPRWVYENLMADDGFFFDPIFKGGYWEDDDLIQRFERDHTEIDYVESVFVDHLDGGGLSMKTIGEQEYHDRNKQVYEDKWSS